MSTLPEPSTAIPIPDADPDLESEPDVSAIPLDPTSYVSPGGPWRPVPPPMLASSLEVSTRYRPIPAHEPPNSQPFQHVVQYGGLGRLPEAVPTPPPQPPSPRPQVPHIPSHRERFSRIMSNLRQLDHAPRELWLIFGVKFLTSYAYFSLSIVLTIFLTDEFGLSDSKAGWAYGAYGVMSTLFGLMCGWLIDFLGVRASLLLGAVIGAISRFIMSVTSSRNLALLMLFTVLPFAESLGIPIMTIGIKRYTNAHNRTFAFSLYYSVMNVAALCAGPLVDASRHFFADGVTLSLFSFGSHTFSGLRLIILSSSIATAAVCFVVMIGIREVQVDESGVVTDYTPSRESPLRQTRRILRERTFWRLTVFTLLLVGVRMVFRHLDATMPKYLVRQFGPDAPFGLVYAINPFLIIFLVPTVGLLTRSVDSFSMILAGSFVAAASPFWICFRETYLAVVLFMVTLSVGEAVYSPRVYEYAMVISPNGAEGIYSSLSSAPLFSVKLLVGGMSGWLLTSFMPAEGPHHGNILWGIVGLVSMISPISIFLLREFISPSSNIISEQALLQTDAVDEDSVSKLASQCTFESGACPPIGRPPPVPLKATIDHGVINGQKYG